MLRRPQRRDGSPASEAGATLVVSASRRRMLLGLGALLPTAACMRGVGSQRLDARYIDGETIDRSIYDAVIDPSGRWALTAGPSGITALWDVETGRRTASVDTESEVVSALALGPGAERAAMMVWAHHGAPQHRSRVRPRPRLELWDIRAGTRVRRLPGPRFEVESMAFSPDGRWLAAVGYGSRAVLWDVASGRVQDSLRLPMTLGTAVAFDRDSSTLAIAHETTWGHSAVSRWTPSDGGVAPWVEHIEGRTLALAVDGERLAIGLHAEPGQEAPTALLWSPQAGSQAVVGSNGPHVDQIESVAFSDDGTQVAMGGGQWCVRRSLFSVPWDDPAAGMLEPHAERAPLDRISCVAARSDGRFVAVGDGIVLWDQAGVPSGRSAFSGRPVPPAGGLILCG